MATTQTDAAPSRAERILGTLLLVPEAPLLLLLLGAYAALGAPPLIGLGLMLLSIGFIARLLALLGAHMAYEAAHYHEADLLIALALTLNPWSPDALALRGSIALALGRPAEAELALRRALARLPGRADRYTALSGTLLALGRPAEAAEAAQAALLRDPACALAQLYLAEAEQGGGMPALDVEARLRTGLALASTPEDEAALRCALGALLFGEQRRAEAMLMLRGAEALLPQCKPARQLELRVRLGELMIAQGQLDRAREQFRSVAALDPSGRYTGAAWRASHLL